MTKSIRFVCSSLHSIGFCQIKREIDSFLFVDVWYVYALVRYQCGISEHDAIFPIWKMLQQQN